MTTRKRSNNSGSIYPFRDKYRAAFTTPAGKRLFKVFTTEEEAQAWLTLQKADVVNDSYIEPSTLTLGQWSAEYLATYCKPMVEESTFNLYKLTAKKLAPLSNIPLQKLNAVTVQKFLNKLELSENMRNKVYKLLNQMIKQAVVVNLLRHNFMEVVKAPQPEHTEIETFTAEEIKKVLDTIATSIYYKKYLPFFTLAVHSGARLGELLGLRITEVEDDRIKIKDAIRSGRILDLESRPKRKKNVKTDSSYRSITLSKKIIDMLREAYRTEPIVVGGYVFHTANGTPYSMRNMERTWERILIEADIPYRKFHALRHTHATELLGKGVPVLEVSRRLGHAKASTTLNIYGHAIKGYAEQIPAIVNEIFN